VFAERLVERLCASFRCHSDGIGRLVIGCWLSMALLSGLDLVPWNLLQHAYGVATDVPELLDALVDPACAPAHLKAAARNNQRTVFEQVEWILWGNVFHQGSVWQASARTVPFLVEILRDGPPDLPLRRFLISYLHHLAIGYPEDTFPRQIDPVRDFAEVDGLRDEGRAAELADFNLQKSATGDDKRLAMRLPLLWARDCYLAVEHAIPTILSFVRDPDEQLALEAIALTASFSRYADAAAPTLRQIATSARGMRAGTAVVALAQLVRSAARQDAERAVASDDPLLAIHGACASVLADADAVSERAITLLTTLDEVTGQRRTPLTETLSALVGRCLARLPPAQIERAVDALAQQHVSANPMTRLSLTTSLLSIAFGDQPAPATAAQLSALQRRALEAIRDHGAWIIVGSQFANYAQLVAGWGLPRDRDLLARWLAT
jgi:hypothetical protein